MKKTSWMMAAFAALALAVAAIGAAGCKSACCATAQSTPQPGSTEKHAVQYFCPMHPEVVQSSPGDCPKCGMKLVAKP
jgi:hypothetical protein